MDTSIYKHYPDAAQADRLLRLENAAVPQVDQVIHTYRYVYDEIIDFLVKRKYKIIPFFLGHRKIFRKIGEFCAYFIPYLCSKKKWKYHKIFPCNVGIKMQDF